MNPALLHLGERSLRLRASTRATPLTSCGPLCSLGDLGLNANPQLICFLRCDEI